MSNSVQPQSTADAPKRNRDVVIGIATVAVIAIVAALIVFFVARGQGADSAASAGADTGAAAAQSSGGTADATAEPTAPAESTAPAAAAVDLGQYADGSPIVLTKGGVGEADASVPTLTEYFDYTCHYCVNVDAAAGPQLAAAAEAGTINIKYQPVLTASMEYAHPATTASLLVAKNEPAKWIDFHHALAGYFKTAYDAQDGTVITDGAASLEAIRKLAADEGISQSVIDQFTVDGADQYLNTATQTWASATVQGRGDSLGTPEYVANDTTQIPLTSIDGPAVISAIEKGLGVTIK